MANENDNDSNKKVPSSRDALRSDSTPIDKSELATNALENAEDSFLSLTQDWPNLSTDVRKEKFHALPRTEAEELFLNLKTRDQAELLAEASLLEKRGWVRLLAPDDVADLIQELGLDHREEILGLLDPQTKREVIALLAYAEDNAGGLMSSRFVRLRPDMNVDEAISYIRIQSRTQVETIYYAYVLNTDQILLGVISFRELFSAAPNRKVTEIMHTDIVQIPVDLDQEQIGRIFSQHDLMALPVIDNAGKMVGIVTFDDIASVIQEEATEDIHKIGAVETLDAPYLDISWSEMIRKRAGWLMILFIGEMFTASALGYFADELERAFVLSLFLPLIISSGGNSGSQASTLIIRAMALGEVRLKDWLRVFTREVLTGLALGLILGTMGLFRIMIWPGRESLYGPHYGMISVTVGCSVVGVVLWGTISGSMLPFLLKKLGLDPASASAPAVATIVDVTGVIIYFTVASIFLKGILL